MLPRGASSARIWWRAARPYSTGAPLPQTVVTNFDNATIAYQNRSTAELFRALVVFQLSGIRPLVSNARALLNLSNRVLGSQLTTWFLKQSFFGHFCAGTSAADARVRLEKLQRSNVGAILDYAAEAELASHNSGNVVKDFKETAAAQVKIFEAAIQLASLSPKGIVAAKVTALCQPEVLQRVSAAIASARSFFLAIGSAAGAAHPNKALTMDAFISGLRALGCEADEGTLRAMFTRIDTAKDGAIDMVEWTCCVPFDKGCTDTLSFRQRQPRVSPIIALHPQDIDNFNAALGHLSTLSQLAQSSSVRLMIDAEQSYLQPAIDLSVQLMQRRYNKNGFPTVYNTYQAYLRETAERVQADIDAAHKEGFILAAKVVRGAYMVQERRLAQENGYADPVQPDIESTHRSYDTIIDKLLDNKKTTDFMIASHNTQSVLHAVRRMGELGIDRSDGGVFFGQLLGMCDNITYTLASSGYASYKYVPYGPVNEVIPYLVRRAEENSTMLSGATLECKLIGEELTRRAKKSLFKPSAQSALPHTPQATAR